MSTTEATSLGGFYTPEEVCELFRIPRSRLYGWREKGEGPPAVLIGGTLRYPKAGLEKWIAERAERAADAASA